jgi:hypothetical protein
MKVISIRPQVNSVIQCLISIALAIWLIVLTIDTVTKSHYLLATIGAILVIINIILSIHYWQAALRNEFVYAKFASQTIEEISKLKQEITDLKQISNDLRRNIGKEEVKER